MVRGFGGGKTRENSPGRRRKVIGEVLGVARKTCKWLVVER
jgi:hypothetical protein